MDSQPIVTCAREGEVARIALSGGWTASVAGLAEQQVGSLEQECAGARRAVLDLSQVAHLDTAGAWIISRAQAGLDAAGLSAGYAGVKPDYQTLLSAARYRAFEAPAPPASSWTMDFLSDVGASVVGAGRDLVHGVAFFGQLVSAIGMMLVRPARLRPTSIVFHLESFAFRSVPIIALISFLVGCIIAQQGIFQLQRFGATPFAVDLIGILVFRELGVLLAAIMIAGRTGSAITAEIGSMKMREEIDAMSVMGLNPVEVLIAPRMLALIIALPLLTFIANMSAVFGGMLVAWGYGDISPEIYLARLQGAIAMNTFLVGFIKAPFMALVIGLIAAVEGFAVKGSAESLGRQVTSSVVKSIFMVIVLDGIFAMFFAAIDY